VSGVLARRAVPTLKHKDRSRTQRNGQFPDFRYSSFTVSRGWHALCVDLPPKGNLARSETSSASVAGSTADFESHGASTPRATATTPPSSATISSPPPTNYNSPSPPLATLCSASVSKASPSGTAPSTWPVSSIGTENRRKGLTRVSPTDDAGGCVCGTIYWTPAMGTRDVIFQDQAFAAAEQAVAHDEGTKGSRHGLDGGARNGRREQTCTLGSRNPAKYFVSNHRRRVRAFVQQGGGCRATFLITVGN
jgi:hypothetical protein